MANTTRPCRPPSCSRFKARPFGAAAFIEDAPVSIVNGAVDENWRGETVGGEARGGFTDTRVGAFGKHDTLLLGKAAETLFLTVEEGGGGIRKSHEFPL